VRLLLVTPADKESHDLTANPADIAAGREGETEHAAHLPGVTDIAFLCHPDAEVECSRAVAGKMVHRLRRWRLEVIFTHDREQPLPPYLAPATIAPSVVDAWMPSIRSTAILFACPSSSPPKRVPMRPHTAHVWLFATPVPSQLPALMSATNLVARLPRGSLVHVMRSPPTEPMNSWE